MHKPEKNRPPRIPLALLHLFSNREQLEDIEGDLLERYYSSLEIDGINKAKWLFTKDVFQILFSGWMIDQLCQKILKMKRINWIKLLAVNILLIFLIVSPFLPGPPNRFVNGLSILGQATGLAGLLLVPVALIWIVYEIRKAKLANTKINWKVPYFLAITFLVIVFLIFGLFAIAIYYIEGWITGTLVSLVIIAVMWLVLRGALRPFEPRDTPMGTQLRAIEIIAEALRGKALFVDTVFNAWNTLKRNIVKGAITELMTTHPTAVEAALGVVNANLIRYAQASLERGAAGIFLSVPASAESLTLEQYERFMRPFDLQLLEAIRGRGECHILHAHGERLFFDRLVDYPVHALSWSDLNGGPTIADAGRRTRLTLMAGLDHVRFSGGDAAEAVATEVRGADAGRPDPVLSRARVLGADHANPPLLRAARAAVAGLSASR